MVRRADDGDIRTSSFSREDACDRIFQNKASGWVKSEPYSTQQVAGWVRLARALVGAKHDLEIWIAGLRSHTERRCF